MWSFVSSELSHFFLTMSCLSLVWQNQAVHMILILKMIKVIHQDNKSPVSGNFWSVSEFFVQPFLKNGHPLIFFGYQRVTNFQKKLNKKFRDWPKIPWDWTIFSLVDQKKWEIDWTIGRPRDWPKPHGRDYNLTSTFWRYEFGWATSGTLFSTFSILGQGYQGIKNVLVSAKAMTYGWKWIYVGFFSIIITQVWFNASE